MWTLVSQWKKQPRNCRNPRANADREVTQAAMIRSDNGLTRHVWKVGGKWQDVDGLVYKMEVLNG